MMGCCCTSRHPSSHSAPPEISILFKQELPQCKKQVTYRIPALIYISDKQTFLAFTEKRKTPSDTDAEVLVMRKGLWKNDNNPVKWVSGQQVFTSACLPNYRSMNPCPVYERESETLFLFFICVPVGVSEQQQKKEKKNQARLCYVTSKNTGKTWSAVTDLTADVIGEQEKNWATFAVGPGHGIQMKSGRLIIPAYTYYFTIAYSDDKGSTWHIGKCVDGESNECQMAEIIDDEGNSILYCNARSTNHYRNEALSESKGKDFDKSSFVNKLIETGQGCQGSMLSFAPNQVSAKTWLLYSHPTNATNRLSLGIYLNKCPSDASGWGNPVILHEGPSGYSDLTQCGDEKHFACLMECGEKSELERIGFVLFEQKDDKAEKLQFTK
ncbi:LOW QUALITY PROTEIN: sialidase 3 (membrane sialidase), tandem duplicate 5 [Danio aesculapii]|uniref:LOW QUALITY PROTEIN: sialidase 3 (membrane sialidase), tandem duplicate 5 n=1 Tax=Danio aesculapii TaxID=1142201 RepID=UPI0024C0198D|nr:LOW QUALITY PROTEIN: sialidase 3 (membrane sialidase), tandem duplicate 5 [Danio aesculapii]